MTKECTSSQHFQALKSQLGCFLRTKREIWMQLSDRKPYTYLGMQMSQFLSELFIMTIALPVQQTLTPHRGQIQIELDAGTGPTTVAFSTESMKVYPAEGTNIHHDKIDWGLCKSS